MTESNLKRLCEKLMKVEPSKWKSTSHTREAMIFAYNPQQYRLYFSLVLHRQEIPEKLDSLVTVGEPAEGSMAVISHQPVTQHEVSLEVHDVDSTRVVESYTQTTIEPLRTATGELFELYRHLTVKKEPEDPKGRLEHFLQD